MMERNELHPMLLRLLKLLEIRRMNSGQLYHVVLPSTVSLTPRVLKQVCGSERWGDFRQAFAGMPTSDKLDLLSSASRQESHAESYLALAHLMQEGYFRTILTANLDSTLEDALLQIGVRDFRVLVVGRESPELIGEILDQRGNDLLILKLHGSVRERVLAERFPNLLDFPGELKESLKRCFNQNLLLIGSVHQDDDLRRLFSARSDHSFYYAPTPAGADAPSQDVIMRFMADLRIPPEHFLIPQPHGDFTRFFPTLLAHLPIGPGQSGQHVARLPLYQPPALSTPASLADVLLITATDVETAALLDQYGGKPETQFFEHRTYYNLGMIGGARVFLVQSEMASSGRAGSHMTVYEGIKALAPRAVIQVGIACGAQPGSQRVGDILISQRLGTYNHLRAGTDPATSAPTILIRGDRASASERLLDRFRTGRRTIDFSTWEQDPPMVFFGLILSADVLIDNQDVIDYLKTHEPEAIGMEMEGAGLYNAATHLKTDWLLVKAISDWGNGFKDHNKSIYQRQAALNAARFVLEILAQGGF